MPSKAKGSVTWKKTLVSIERSKLLKCLTNRLSTRRLMKQIIVAINAVIQIVVPLVPNFLNTTNHGQAEVGDFNDEALKEIGARWTENLLTRAQEQRRAKVK